ncbi:MAG: CrcB family protein [Acidobacteriota bacterium]|nr:CrcB family protein [Acidobacteriota bacterium]
MRGLARRELAAVLAGGAAGAVLRVWLAGRFSGGAPSWPWATFSINVSGCFALAYIATCLHERLPASALTGHRPHARIALRALGTGLCATYSTFATMQIEILVMIDAGRYGLAGGYALASVLCGYLAIAGATALARPRSALA